MAGAGTDIHPRVFVDLTAKKTTAVRTLLADDFSSFNISRIIDEQGAPFTTTEVFCFVKALRGECAKGTQIATPIFAK